MVLRAVIFEPHASVRGLLESILTRRGYEVQAYACAYRCMDCQGGYCTDLIIADVQTGGAEILLAKRQVGCRVPHFALIAGSWSEADRRAMHLANCVSLTKPFSHAAIHRWLDHVEQNLPPGRVLSTEFPPKPADEDIL